MCLLFFYFLCVVRFGLGLRDEDNSLDIRNRQMGDGTDRTDGTSREGNFNELFGLEGGIVSHHFGRVLRLIFCGIVPRDDP
jgi:hypothetical protein